MWNKFFNYDGLKVGFEKSVSNLLIHHKVKAVSSLPLERQWQVKFLQKMSEGLDRHTMVDDDKLEIFTASIYLIRAMIEDTYSVGPAYLSHFYCNLGAISGFGVEENILNPSDKVTLMQKLDDFFLTELSSNGQIIQGMKTEHLFSEIKGFGADSDNTLLLKFHEKLERELGDAKIEQLRLNAGRQKRKEASTQAGFFHPGASETSTHDDKETTAVIMP